MLTSDEKHAEIILRLNKIIDLLERMAAPKVASVSVGEAVLVERGMPDHWKFGERTSVNPQPTIRHLPSWDCEHHTSPHLCRICHPELFTENKP